MVQAETLNSLADPVYKRSKNIVPYKTTYLLRNVLSITGKNKKVCTFFLNINNLHQLISEFVPTEKKTSHHRVISVSTKQFKSFILKNAIRSPTCKLIKIVRRSHLPSSQ